MSHPARPNPIIPTVICLFALKTLTLSKKFRATGNGRLYRQAPMHASRSTCFSWQRTILTDTVKARPLHSTPLTARHALRTGNCNRRRAEVKGGFRQLWIHNYVAEHWSWTSSARFSSIKARYASSLCFPTYQSGNSGFSWCSQAV